MPRSQLDEQPAADTTPPVCRMHRQVQQLGLGLREPACDGESRKVISTNSHDDIVRQIVMYVPLRGLGGYRLHCGDARKIAWLRAAHD